MLWGRAAPWSHYNRQLMVMGRGETHRGIQRATLHWGGTLRTNRYRKQNQKALCNQREVTDSTLQHNFEQTNSLRGKKETIQRLSKRLAFSACFYSIKSTLHCQYWQLSKTTWPVKGTDRYVLLIHHAAHPCCSFTLSEFVCSYDFMGFVHSSYFRKRKKKILFEM